MESLVEKDAHKALLDRAFGVWRSSKANHLRIGRKEQTEPLALTALVYLCLFILMKDKSNGKFECF